MSASFSWNVKDQLLDAHRSTTTHHHITYWKLLTGELLSIRSCQKHKNWLYYKIKDSKTNVKHLAYTKGYFRHLVKISILTAKLCMQPPKMIWFDSDMLQCLVDSVLITGQQERSSGLTGCRCDCWHRLPHCSWNPFWVAHTGFTVLTDLYTVTSSVVKQWYGLQWSRARDRLLNCCSQSTPYAQYTLTGNGQMHNDTQVKMQPSNLNDSHFPTQTMSAGEYKYY